MGKFAVSLFIINSTNIDNELKKKFLSNGGHFIFQKPYGVNAYNDIIRQILKQFG